MLGFEEIFFRFDEDARNLTNVFSIAIQNGIVSEQNLPVNITITVNGASNPATPGHYIQGMA